MIVWVKELLKSLDNNLDEAKRIAVMEACGENCPFTHLPDQKLLDIKQEARDADDFIMKLSQEWRVKLEDAGIYVVFDKCYCPLINQDLAGASPTLCYCTLGNIKKKFRLGLGREVDVLMEKTILAGDNECRFKVLI